MKIVGKYLLFVALFINISGLKAQPEIDSLVQVLSSASENEKKVDLMVLIASRMARTKSEKAIYYGNEAYDLAKASGYTKGISDALAGLGYTYYHKSDYPAAMEVFLKKLKLDDSTGNKTGMAETYNLIGNIYYYIKDFPKAIEYLNKSMELFQELKDDEGLGNIYTCIANIHEANGDYQKAEHLYITGLSLHEKVNDVTDIIISNTNLGNLYYRDYGDTSALKYFAKALSQIPVISNKSTQTFVYVNVGDYWLWRDWPDSAMHYLNLGYELASANSLTSYLRELSGSLSKLYANLGDYEKAYRYLGLYNHYNDSIFSSKNSSYLAFLEYEYNLEKLENVRKTEFLGQQRKSRTRLLILISLSLLAVSGTGLRLIYSNIKIKQQKLSSEKLNLEKAMLQGQLELREKEIMIVTTNLFERNELIGSVIKKLRSLIPGLTSDGKKGVYDIISSLREKYHENILSEFEVRFLNIHQSFYENLQKDFPALTSNDLRLCAFLKMNMNTKDIASLTHQNVNTVEVARSRLRKKLNIDHADIDLSVFLSRY
mgnify:FL=1